MCQALTTHAIMAPSSEEEVTVMTDGLEAETGVVWAEAEAQAIVRRGFIMATGDQ